MVWPFKRSKTAEQQSSAGERLEEARAAREKAERDLLRVEGLWPQVRNTADELNDQLDKNHLAARFRTALGG
jgi:enterochelin esterase-like enzyme